MCFQSVQWKPNNHDIVYRKRVTTRRGRRGSFGHNITYLFYFFFVFCYSFVVYKREIGPGERITFNNDGDDDVYCFFCFFYFLWNCFFLLFVCCELSFHNLLKNYQVSSVSYLLHHTHLFHTPKWWCPHRILGSVCFGFSLARSREGANCGWPRVPFVSTSLRRDLLPLVLIINIMFITFL